MNPRVSRSSALASKATGYPIAKVAAKLAVGYTLDEIPNDLTGHDAGELRADARLRRRQVAALRVREVPRRRPDARHADEVGRRVDGHRPHLRRGVRQGAAAASTPSQAWQPGEPAPVVRGRAREPADDRANAAPERRRLWTRLVYRRVDSCAGEVEAASNYFYSTRGERDEAPPGAGPLGRDPRQRPEPDRAGDRVRLLLRPRRQSFRAQGYEAVMVNCNPETVSTDYDTSDRLYFEPLDEEAVLAVLEREQPVGVVHPVRRPDAAEARAGDRARRLPDPRHAVRRDRPRRGPRALRRGSRRELGVRCPEWGIARDADEAVAIAARIGYPVLVRPSYVLGGRAMRVCYDGRPSVDAAMRGASSGAVLVDRFLENAIELDVDALCDGDRHLRRRGDGARRGGRDPLRRLVVRPAGAVRRRARDRASSSAGSGRRSASSACSTSSSRSRDGEVYVLEVEPARVADGAVRVEGDRRRTSSTPPAASPRARASPTSACRPSGRRAGPPRQGGRAAVRALPRRRPGARPRDALDGRGDGERGRLRRPRSRRPSAPRGARCPTGGRAFLSVRDADKAAVLPVARALAGLGFELVATAGTARGARATPGSPVERGREGRRRSCDLVRAPRRRPRRQHARGPQRAHATATRSARPRWSRACPCITTLAVARGRGRRRSRARCAEPARHAPGADDAEARAAS